MSESKYYPLFSYWKRYLSILILILLLIMGGTLVYCTSSNFPEGLSTEEHIHFTTLKVLLSIIVLIGIFISILRILKIYSENLEKERNILSDLYAEEQKRIIIRTSNSNSNSNSNTTEAKLQQEVQSLTMRLEELKKTYRQQVEIEITAKYQQEKIKYLEEINKQLLAHK